MHQKLEDKFKIISFLDKARWNNKENYGNMELVDEVKNDFESKILTHWLSYIEDRQTDYRKVWKIGTFAISKIVKLYRNDNKSVKDLMGDLSEKSLYQKDTNVFLLDTTEEDEIMREQFKNYYSKDGKKLYYSLRYPDADYYSIYRTLKILQEVTKNKSLIEYLAKAINTYMEKNKTINEEELVKVMASALYYLTYYVEKDKNEKVVIIDKENFFNDLIDKYSFIEKFYSKGNVNSKKYNSKRLWCSLRDYIKSPRFKEKFKESLLGYIENKEYKKIINGLFEKGIEKYLELPGDVWNNNPEFRECIFEEDIDKKGKLNKRLRELYKEEKNKMPDWYPEQFDVTFNLASRMCRNNNCNICPFSIWRKENEGKERNVLKTIEGICKYNKDKDSFCTVALTLCGYKVKCSDLLRKDNTCIVMEILEKASKK